MVTTMPGMRMVVMVTRALSDVHMAMIMTMPARLVTMPGPPVLVVIMSVPILRLRRRRECERSESDDGNHRKTEQL